jgi:hypothetical protein
MAPNMRHFSTARYRSLSLDLRVGSGRRAMHHFMVEVGSLDDLGQGS